MLKGRKILGVGAHPDDLELSCFGTLLQLREENDVHVVVMSGKGESYEEESRQAMLLLEPDTLEFQAFKMGQIPIEWDTVSVVDRLVEQHEIDLILTHAEWDTHQDHVMTERIVRAATRRRPISVIGFHSISSTPEFLKNIVVDISNELETKLSAVGAFKSWADKSYMQREWLREWHHEKLATSVGFRYVELFHLYRAFL